jgi:phage baseplate assembly protein V
MIRFGIISETDPSKGLARVAFQEDELTSDWLPYIVSKAAKDSYFYCPDVGEHVACLMDENAENGVILGAIYDTKAAPKEAGPEVSSVVFEDGSKVVFDRSNGSLTIDAKGEVVIKAAPKVTLEANEVEVKGNLKITGAVDSMGGIKSSGSIEAVGDVVAGPTGARVRLLTHLHPTAAPGPPSPPTPTP